MADKLRSINTHFWDDNYIVQLDPIEKLLFLYLLSNPLTNIAGAYEITLRRIAFDTGIDSEMVNKMLNRFSEDNKIRYVGGWLILKNFIKNQHLSDKALIGANKIISCLPDNIRIAYDSLSKPLLKVQKGAKQIESESEIEIELKAGSGASSGPVDNSDSLPLDIPTKEDIQESSKPKIVDDIENISKRLYDEKIFNKVHAFKNRYFKIGKNERAILHALSRCYMARPEEPWGYCCKIIGVEDGNYNERANTKSSR